MDTTKSLYNDLVKDEDDIVGMITYAFYKMHKLEYIENTFGNAQITDTDIDHFKKTITKNSKAGFQLSAVQALKKTTDLVIDEHRAILLDSVLKETLAANKNQNAHVEELIERQKQVLTDFENKIKQVLSDNVAERNKFSWSSFWIGIAGNLVASFIWLLIVFIIWVTLIDDSKKAEVLDKAGKIFLNKDLQEPTKEP